MMALPMTALGQKPKSLHLSGVSVAPSGADIRRLARHGRKVPNADLAAAIRSCARALSRRTSASHGRLCRRIDNLPDITK